MPNISPRLLKGVMVMLDATLGVTFGTGNLQYNPDEVTRSLKPQSVGGSRTTVFENLRYEAPAGIANAVPTRGVHRT